ncbi:hypothetical protein PMM47T1_04024 [Pseudomonas sp. M47T1]|uniref:hypothetical protein n=1 Tax=Pseudomonas sp. M47T1 TaxID=1179778 RepID=UPI0002607805|nr:hypothetical protein [Pseudomonas sp. M47T1]EIK97647.1 hypothetical protein PMM47T1_04024 [Pseudomonas sp. M47T1]
MIKTALSWLALAASIGTAQASSDQAWNEHDDTVINACIAASQLKAAQAVGRPAEFDDSVGYSAILLQGHYPQPHMKNALGRELCLFDKQRQSAHVSEWDSIMNVRKP